MSFLGALGDKSFIERQLGVTTDPIVVINLLTLDAADNVRSLGVWTLEAAFMKRRSALISTRRQRAFCDSQTYPMLRPRAVCH